MDTKFTNLLLYLLISILANSIHAQQTNLKYSVKGILADSLSQEGEPYATLRIARIQAPQEPVSMAITNTQGEFNQTLAQPGEYTITFTSVGKNTVARNFTLSDTRPCADLGVIFISESNQILKGVEVVAQKPLVKAEIDKITYSIEDDPDTKTHTTLDMLKKVPLVTVDGEDNIQVNGSKNFKVHVNGKPNTLMSNNPKEVFRSLPASSIKSIEVITEPGAKYDAEGVGGILNIITTNTHMQGYNVTLGTNIHNRGVGGYAYSTIQAGKFTLSANYSYNHQNNPPTDIESERTDYTSESHKYLHTDGTSQGNGNFQFGNLEGSYEIDTLNLISFSANLFDGAFKSENRSFTSMQDHACQTIYRYNTFSNSYNKFGNMGANIDYQHSFRNKGEYLTLSYKYDGSPDRKKSETQYYNITDVPFNLQNQHYNNNAHTAEHTAQIDYVNPINEKHYIDAGLKYIYRQNSSNSRYFHQQDDGSMLPDEHQSDKFNHDQNILAAYTDYQLKWKKFGLKAGLRYEHTFTDVTYTLHPERNFNTGFSNLVPSANISYMLGNSMTLKANYNMRINRPGIWYLNPFKDTSNPTSVKYGNANLDTEKAHIIGTTFSSFTAKFSINLGISYMFINNGIEPYSFINNGIQENTYRNAGKTQNTRLSLWMNWNPGNTTRISINAGGGYADYKSTELDAHNYGFNGNLFANIQQTLPWELRLSIYGGGSTPYITLQGNGSSYYYYGINLSRSFLKEKRLNLALFTNNFFNQYQDYWNETITHSFRYHTNNRYYTMGYGFSISWRFGELKTQVKKTARSINNDDIKSGERNSSNTQNKPAM